MSQLYLQKAISFVNACALADGVGAAVIATRQFHSKQSAFFRSTVFLASCRFGQLIILAIKNG